MSDGKQPGSYTWPAVTQAYALRLVTHLPDGFLPSGDAEQVAFWRMVLEESPRGSDNIGRPLVVIGLNGPRPSCCTEEYARFALHRLGACE